MTKKNQQDFTELSSDISEMVTAEFWVKNFSEYSYNASFSPVQNFNFNLLKARILLASAQEIRTIWPKINNRLIQEEIKDITSEFAQLIVAFIESIETGLASYYVFTEQALVSTVSASEVYFKDNLANTIQNDKRVLKCYLDKDIKVKRILETGLDLNDCLSILIVEKMNFQNLNNLQSEYKKIFGFKPLNKTELKELKRIFAIRHLIIHRAGIVDNIFLSETGMNYKIGNRIVLERDEILKMINFVSKIVTKTELKMKSKTKKEENKCA